jgi:hypothetical protein
LKFLRAEVTIPPDLMRDLAQESALKPLGFSGGQSKQLTFSILTHRLGPAASTPVNRNRTASLSPIFFALFSLSL